MKNVILIVQIVISLVLITVVVIQARGTGLGSALGGSGESYRSKRGFERILFIATIFIAIIFFLTSIVSVLA